jgi:dipeptidyl-peptidase-4
MAPLACALALMATAVPPASPPDPFLLQRAETRNFRAGTPTEVALAPDGRAALFLRSGPRSRVQGLYELDLVGGELRALAGPDQTGPGEATADEAARLERQRIQARGVTQFELSRDGHRVAFSTGGRLYVLDRPGGSPRALAVGEGVIDPRLSPDGRSIAFVKGRDLHVVDVASGALRRLTRARGPGFSNGLAEFVAQEEMGRDRGFWWSPDGTRLAFAEVDESEVPERTLCDPAHPERPCQRFRYPRAGGPNARVRLAIVPARGGRAVFARWDGEAFPYLAAVTWERGGPLSVLVQNRAQTVERLYAVDPSSGATRLLLEERDPAWLDLFRGFPLWREDGRGFFWATDRNGATEVEWRGADGAALGTVVPRESGFVRLGGWDGERGVLWYVGAPDPTREVVQRVEPGSKPEAVAFGDERPGLRWAEPSRDGSAVHVRVVTSAGPERSAVFDASGALVRELPSLAEAPPFTPTTEIRRIGAGGGLWTAILRPRTPRAGKLPVLLEVYGGPVGAADVPMAAHRPLYLEQWLADRGFVVILADGRGTPRRGRDFERAISGDFSEIPLADQIAALGAVGAEVPEADLGRVGIFGWSFGGYLSALAVLRRPDVFRAAVAGAPVSDWREYDTHYTERYLRTPQENPAGYDRSGLLGWAPALERPLLVVHGTADDNVYLTHSLALSNALLRAGRPHQFLPLSGATHMVPDPVVAAREWERVAAFLEEALAPPRRGD